jgi:predicted ATPase
VTVVVGQCLSYGQATPYLPVRALLRQVCRLAEGDAAAVHMAAVQQRLHASGMTAEEDVALLLELLDLPVAPECLARRSPEARQVRTFALLRHLVVHAAGTQVAVPPLRGPDSRAVVQAVLGAVVLPEVRLRALLAQARGNPFFLEELAWHAVAHDQPDTPGTVPETVPAVLAARMDRLPPAAKRLLQVAVVIGMDVSFPLLQALAEQPEEQLQQSLAHLHAAEFLYETRLFPEPEYTFKHALTHEVAYNSLLLERRRALDARIVEVLEALSGDRVVEQVERLAHHALRGEVWDKAMTYCQQAGVRAWDRAAFREAVTSFEQALQTLAHLPESGDTRVRAIEIRLALGSPLTTLGEHRRRLTLLGEAEVLARALDDRARLGRVLSGMASALRQTGDHDGAIGAGQQALELAVALGESALQAQASYTLGQAYQAIGDFGRAAELCRRNVAAADRESGTPSTD